jgi:predicted dehydrogenase
MKQINWGIIGCGNVTEVKSGPAFNKISGSNLVAVMRRNGAKARDYAERHGVPKWYDDAQQLISDPEVNAVYIATPPDSHAHYTQMAAQAGKPVYVEKPMALSFAECQDMIVACEQARVPLFVAYYRRRLPTFLKVKELIDAGAIGACRLVSVELWRPMGLDEQDAADLPWRVQPAIAGGGHFVDLATHQLDFLDYMFGPITMAKGTASNQSGLYPAEDTVCASLQFESGVIGSGIWCFSTAPNEKRDLIRIIGTRGRLSFSTFDHTVPITLETGQKNETFTPPTPQHIQQPLIETICQALQGSGHCPSTGKSAARTTRVVDQILADWRDGLEIQSTAHIK